MIILDLFDFDPKYYGGVSRFALGFLEGLASKIKVDQFVVVCDERHKNFFIKNFPDVNINSVKRKIFDKKIYAILCIISSLLRLPKLVTLIKYYRKIVLQNLDSHPIVVIVPTSTINFFEMPCTILCIHDIQHEIHPENFNLLERLHRWARFRISAAHAKNIQVSSDYIADNLMEYYGPDIREKCFKVYEGYSSNSFSRELKKENPFHNFQKKYIYFPAQLWVHKNHKTVIEGLSIFAKGNEPIALVISGRDYGQYSNIVSLCDFHRVELIYLEYVTDAEMRFLYANSVAVIAAGYHESSSLPLREALACGAEVIASDIPPNLEIRFLNLVHYFSTFSAQSFASQLHQSIDNPKNKNNSFELIEKYFEWKNIINFYIPKLA